MSAASKAPITATCVLTSLTEVLLIAAAECSIANFRNDLSCSPDRLALFVSKLHTNIQLASQYHQQLFLGTKAGSVRRFQDQRLLVSLVAGIEVLLCPEGCMNTAQLQICCLWRQRITGME